MSLSMPDILRRLPRGLIGTLALVAACESYIAANDLRFSRMEPDDWRQAGQAAGKERTSGGVLFFGDSQVKFGFSPTAIEAKVGKPSRSLAIVGGQPTASYFLLRKALEAGARPSAIVVDFEIHLLRDKVLESSRMWSELADFREMAELAWATGDRDSFAAMALGRMLPSYRERLEIRGNLLAALRGETPNTAVSLEAARRNRRMNHGASVLTRSGVVDHQVSFWGIPGDKPWAPTPINQTYVDKFLGLARDHGIPVYCAVMPVDQALLKKLIYFGMEAPYLAWLRGLQDRYPNLTVLDWRDSKYGSLVFMDALHLNVDGVSAISAALGEYLRRAERGEGRDLRWVKMPEYRLDGTEVAVEDFATSDMIMRAEDAKRRR